MKGTRSLLLTLALVLITGSVQAGGCLLVDSASYQVSYVVVADQAECDAYQPTYTPTTYLDTGLDALSSVEGQLTADDIFNMPEIDQAGQFFLAGFVLPLTFYLVAYGVGVLVGMFNPDPE